MAAAMIACFDRWDAVPRSRLPSLLGVLAALIALSLLARLEPPLALVLIGALLAGTAMLLPRLGLALLVMMAPIQGLLGISRQEMPMLLALLMAAVNLRHLADWRRLPEDWRRGSLSQPLKIFALFILFYLLRGLVSLPVMSDERLQAFGREGAFLVLLFGVALAARRRCWGEGGDALRLSMMAALALSLGLTLLFDGVAVYAPSWSLDLGLLPSWQGLRLAGLHANPNATAKFLLAGLSFALAASWRFGGFDGEAAPPNSRRWLGLSLAAAMICAVAVGATLSKSSLLGGVVALGLVTALFWHLRRRPAALTALLSGLGLLVLALGFDAALALGLGEWTVHRRFEAEHIVRPLPPPPPPGAEAPRKPDLVARIGRELRMAQSHDMTLVKPLPRPDGSPAKLASAHSEMYRNMDGVIEYKERDCGLGCTGQRDRLWKAGLTVVGEHWLLGIGPAAWPEAFMERLQFPFDTPHNVLLEIWGGFGLAGLALYGALAVALLRQLKAAFQGSFASRAAAIHARGTMMFVLVIMVSEWVDPCKLLTMNPHALWLWPLLAGIVIPDDKTLPERP